MALQSQMARTGTRTSNVSGKSSAGTLRVVGIAAAVLGVGGGVVYLVRGRTPQNALAENTVAMPVSKPSASPVGTPASTPVSTPVSTPAPTPAAAVPDSRPPLPTLASKPAPDVVEMGSGTRPGTSTAPAVENPRTNLALQQSGTPGPSASPQNPVTTTPPANPAANPGAQPGTSPSGTAPMPTLGGLPSDLAIARQAADRAIGEKKLVEARTHLNKILVDTRISDADRANYRRQISDLNKELVFSPQVFAGDPLSETYKVQKGDNLIRISRKLNTVTEAHLIERVNQLPNANSLKIDQQLKIVRGPFHAVVSKSGYRMDVYAGPAVSPGSVGQQTLGGGAEPGWTYICSFPVGLGEKGVTPLGAFTVKDNSKLINPPWVNPRTGEKFDKDDPKNPIGERWIGLVGLDDKTKSYTGYGVHGTIDPGSIGQELSMGCVRMQSADVEIVYEMLMPRISIVKIVP